MFRSRIRSLNHAYFVLRGVPSASTMGCDVDVRNHRVLVRKREFRDRFRIGGYEWVHDNSKRLPLDNFVLCLLTGGRVSGTEVARNELFERVPLTYWSFLMWYF